jgi:HSP20 family molecular chaperone IbpA
MFRELSRLIEAATELAGHAAASGAAVVDVRTRIATLRHEARRVPVSPRGPAVDVFNEDDHYMVVAELRGVDRASVKWHLKDERVLVIHAAGERRTYHREIELATAVNAETAIASYDNGVLELRVWKQ